MRRVAFALVTLVAAGACSEWPTDPALDVEAQFAVQSALHGEGTDARAPQLGVITWVSNKSGYQFWFTPVANIKPYVAGHSYHNVYKLVDKIGDGSEWAGPVVVPNRPPYSDTGHAGMRVYYKIFDTTTDTQIAP